MIKVGTTQIKHVKIVEDSTTKEMNYVKDSSGNFLYARPFTLLFTQKNCKYSVKRISSNEPSASVNVNLSTGAQIYYGDVLQITSLTANFGYKNPKVYLDFGREVTGNITVEKNVTLTSDATRIVTCTIYRGDALQSYYWYAPVNTINPEFGYRLKNGSSVLSSPSEFKTSGTITVYAPSLSQGTTLQICGRYNGSVWVVKEITIKDTTNNTYSGPENATCYVEIYETTNLTFGAEGGSDHNTFGLKSLGPNDGKRTLQATARSYIHLSDYFYHPSGHTISEGSFTVYFFDENKNRTYSSEACWASYYPYPSLRSFHIPNWDNGYGYGDPNSSTISSNYETASCNLVIEILETVLMVDIPLACLMVDFIWLIYLSISILRGILLDITLQQCKIFNIIIV